MQNVATIVFNKLLKVLFYSHIVTENFNVVEQGSSFLIFEVQKSCHFCNLLSYEPYSLRRRKERGIAEQPEKTSDRKPLQTGVMTKSLHGVCVPKETTLPHPSRTNKSRDERRSATIVIKQKVDAVRYGAWSEKSLLACFMQ